MFIILICIEGDGIASNKLYLQ